MKCIEIKESSEENKEEFFKKLIHPEIFFMFLSITVDFTTKTFYYPTLTNHLLKEYGYGVEISSLFFVVDMCSYFFFLRFTDPITEKIGLKATIIIGHFINFLTTPLIGPFSIFPK